MSMFYAMNVLNNLTFITCVGVLILGVIPKETLAAHKALRHSSNYRSLESEECVKPGGVGWYFCSDHNCPDNYECKPLMNSWIGFNCHKINCNAKDETQNHYKDDEDEGEHDKHQPSLPSLSQTKPPSLSSSRSPSRSASRLPSRLQSNLPSKVPTRDPRKSLSDFPIDAVQRNQDPMAIENATHIPLEVEMKLPTISPVKAQSQVPTVNPTINPSQLLTTVLLTPEPTHNSKEKKKSNPKKTHNSSGNKV